jgi:signal transduction histidine kinase
VSWAEIQAFLVPDDVERDEGFRQEVLRQGHFGLRVLGASAVGGAIFIFLSRFVIAYDPAETLPRLWACLALMGCGIVALALGQVKACYEWSRRLMIAMAWLIAAVSISASLYFFSSSPAAEHFIPGQVTLIVMVAVVAAPLRPMQTLVLGVGMGVIYGAVAAFASRTFLPGNTVVDPTEFLFISMITLIAVAMSSVLYAQRAATFLSHAATVRAAEELRLAQQQVGLAESASSLTRLAAALSHELNTPIGALTSGIDTLLLLTSRQAAAGPDESGRLLKLQASLRKTIQDSAKRLQQIAARLNRFTNLDQASLQMACVNEMIDDVRALVKPQLKPDTVLEFDAVSVPRIRCNPQQISAVLYDLLSNAAASVNGNGKVRIETRTPPGRIEVRITDNGKGIPPEEVDLIFDPTFREADGRVKSGNWSMFNARQIIRAHQGEIKMESQPGVGSTVTISLPVGSLS